MRKILIFLFLAGCHEPPKKGPPKIPVHVAPVIQKTVPYWIDSVGNVVANNNVVVIPQATGEITEIHVKEGQMVKKGDLLYVIDPKPYEAALLSAQGNLEKDKANLALQKITLERYSKLIPDNYVSKLQVETLETNIQTAEGQIKSDEGNLNTAKINLEYCYVRSPVTGKISQYNINLGNVVTANNANNFLTTIRELQPVQVQFSFPQKEFELIHKEWKGEKMVFECSLYNDKNRTFKGDVYFLDNIINTNTGAILLKGKYPNDDFALWPGAFVRVKMLLKILDNAVLVPLVAVEKGQKGFTVFVEKEDKTAELRIVEIGPQIDDYYVVNAGLQPGEKVVTLGQLNLLPGSLMEIQP
jgi:multidrug efflux system membrane fusion protein